METTIFKNSKLLLLILMVALCYNIVSAQTTAVQQWVQFYNGPDSLNDAGFSIDVHGNIYVSGASQVPPYTPQVYKITTIKYSPSGVQQWVAIYDSISNASFKSMAMKVDVSSNVYVTGSVINNQFNQTTDIIVLKYDSTGTLLWASMYAYPYGKSDEPKAIALDQSGNVYVTGFVSDTSTVSGTGISKDFVTLKYNSAGVQQWVALYSDNAQLDEVANDIAVDNTGNVYVTGYSVNSTLTRDFTTIKYNANGIQQWLKKYDGGNNDFANKLALDNSNNIYITGASINNGSEDYATIKYSDTGVQLWVALYNGTGNGSDVAKDIAIDNNGQIIITGTSSGSGTGNDYATVKYAPNGNQLWVATYNGTGNGADDASSLSLDISGNIYITGQSAGITTGNDYATVKYNTSGVQQWAVRFDGVANSTDVATDIKADSYGNVYVTGYSHNGIDYDFATIKYSETTSTPLSVSITTNDATCNGAANGTAGAIASGGTPPYTYQWSNGQTTPNITGLVAGIYTIIVTDSAAATATATASINEPPIDTLSSPAACSELFISEYIEGTSHNQAIEIYNPTDTIISLNRYFLRVFMNGAPTPLITQLIGAIAPKQTYVIANPHADIAILNVANQTSNKINFNGDDAIQFIKVLNNININIDSIEGHGGNPHDIFDTLQLDILDQIGIPNVTPGNGGWPVGNNGSTKNSTLIRNFGVSSGQSNWNCGQNQWQSMPQNDISNLGIHQNVCASDEAYLFLWLQDVGTDCVFNYYTFDIMAQSYPNKIFNNCVIDIAYSPEAFGTYIVANGGVTVSPGNDFWSYSPLDITDLSESVIQITFGDYSSTSPEGTVISTEAQALLQVSMNIQGCHSSSINFTDISSTNQLSYYTEKAIDYLTLDSTQTGTYICGFDSTIYLTPYDCDPWLCDPWNCGTEEEPITCWDTCYNTCYDTTYVYFDIWCDSYDYFYDTTYYYYNVQYSITNYSYQVVYNTPCPAQISDFTPVVHPGSYYPGNYTEHYEMDINGFCLGTAQGNGNVYFPNADDGGQSYVPLNAYDIISWTDNQIQIRMPSVIEADTNLVTPGGCVFYIKTDVGDSLSSLSSLQGIVSMPYAIREGIPPQPYSFMKGRVNLVNFNHLGGYTFRLDTSITHYPDTNLIPAIKRAVANWRCAIKVNFIVGEADTILASDASDGVSVIYFTDQLQNNVLMSTNVHVYLYANSQDTAFIVHDIDIAIRRNPLYHPWYIDVVGNHNLPSDSSDFLAAIQHELGHATLLEHVITTTDLMYYKMSPGPVVSWLRKEITDDDVAGGISVVNRSIDPNVYSGGYGPMIPIFDTSKVLCTYHNGVTELKPDAFSMSVYPNPIHDNLLNIDYEIMKNSRISFTFVDIVGKLIFSASFQQAVGKYEKTITFENIAAGIYFLKADVNGVARSFKLVKIY